MSNTLQLRRRPRGFAQIPNSTLRDNALSLEARGLLAYLLSYPDGWEIRVGPLRADIKLGRDKLRRILAELRGAKYIIHSKSKDANGRWTWLSEISETPIAEGSKA